MQTRINPALVGGFVLGLSLLLVGMVVWLAGDRDQSDYLRYRVEVSESVAGLNERATVTYRGVEVGFVEAIRLSPDLERIELLLRIAPDYPLREGTTATLRSQLLTGRSSVELSGGEGPVLPQGAPPPAIAYQPSRLFQLDQVLGEALDRVDLMAERLGGIGASIEALLGEENRDSVARLLESVAGSAERLEALLDDEAMASFQTTLDNLAVISTRLERFSGGALADLDGLGDEARGVLAELGITLEQLTRGASESFSLTGEQARQTLRRFDRLVEELATLTRELEANPRQLLFGPERHPPGPGER
ncbi:MlaD family protein [Halomonas salifodinae]|uniref:MlaD family protein n=1 Tax=Halomonas salifodinae TaxID=438745 RepID=A0ABW2EQL8_9GAMM